MVALIAINNQANAQLIQNAMDFDGIDDYITVPNASSYVANGNMSISFWVYPTNPAPNYPNFDGFAGFRNNTTADFYILHLSTTTVEARFRNSAGANFDIIYAGLVPNAWNHFAMTISGTEFSLYHNGVSVNTITATGSFSSTTESLSIGYTPFNSPDFRLDGKLDDVALWSKSLSGSEVAALFNQCNMDLTASGLQLCYEFDQGVAGGNNSSITSALDSKGNTNGTMNGFGLNGTSSNFVANPRNGIATQNINTCGVNTYTSPSGNYVWTASGTYLDTINNGSACDSFLTVNLNLGMPSAATISASSCNSYTSPSGNFTWSTAGTYTDVIPNWQGCDSTLTINLTIGSPSTGSTSVTACDSYTSPSGGFTWTNSGTYADLLLNQFGCDSTLTINLTINDTPDTSVTRNFDMLTATETNTTYQWLDCSNNYAPIVGATSQSFQVLTNGNYAVQLDNNGCVDTSSCLTVVNVGTAQTFTEPVSLFPNPTTGKFWLDLGAVHTDISIQIMNAVGQVVLVENYNGMQRMEFDVDLPNGIYFLEVKSGDKLAVMKFIKE